MNLKKILIISFLLLLSSCATTEQPVYSEIERENKTMEDVETKEGGDVWHIFPAQLEGKRAWFAYNHSYSGIADTDLRIHHLAVQVTFKNTTETGTPTNEEFERLVVVDEKLDEYISNNGGVYIGRVTVGGLRTFHYYVDFELDKAEELVQAVENETEYSLKYYMESDPEKLAYWNELYPTFDDWQVIQDVRVLRVLMEEGDIAERQREVLHWAYFPSMNEAELFKQWVVDNSYTLMNVGKAEESNLIEVQYSHFGSMDLADITSHTIHSNRKARDLGGEYDGWETSVEKF